MCGGQEKVKTELIEDTNLDQESHVMKMEKESEDSKNMERMCLTERQPLLAIMEAGVDNDDFKLILWR